MASQKSGVASRPLSIAIHALGLTLFAISICQIPSSTNPLRRGFGGPYKFLTIVGLMMSTMTFAVGLLADIFDSGLLSRIKNYLSLCATPLEVLIATFYWSLFAIDRTMLTPPGHELPLNQDLGLHATPTIMLMADLLFLSPRWSITPHTAFVLDLGIAFSYWGWIEYCFSINGWYPYPILLLQSSFSKLLICTFWAALLAITTMLLGRLHERASSGNSARPEMASTKRD